MGVVALGAVLLAGASDIAFGVGYDRVGPRAFPFAVGGGLIALGAALAWVTRRRPATQVATRAVALTDPGVPTTTPSAAPVRLDARALLTLGLALVAFVLLLEPAGFVVAAACQFALAARAFHSASPGRDVLLGLAVSTIVYVGFTMGLGTTLPPSPLTLGQP